MSNAIGLKKTKLKAEAKLNPFEIRFTKAKHTVVNRPVQRESGKPGITRALGIKKRKETLLQEYRMKDKTNVFLDRRIGEKVNKLHIFPSTICLINDTESEYYMKAFYLTYLGLRPITALVN